jgi:hypothetical protein
MAPIIDPNAGRDGATAVLERDRGSVGDPVESAPEPSARLDQRIGASGPESRAVSPTWMTASAPEPEVRAVQIRLAGDTELGEVGPRDVAAAIDVEEEARARTEVEGAGDAQRPVGRIALADLEMSPAHAQRSNGRALAPEELSIGASYTLQEVSLPFGENVALVNVGFTMDVPNKELALENRITHPNTGYGG